MAASPRSPPCSPRLGKSPRSRTRDPNASDARRCSGSARSSSRQAGLSGVGGELPAPSSRMPPVPRAPVCGGSVGGGGGIRSGGEAGGGVDCDTARSPATRLCTASSTPLCTAHCAASTRARYRLRNVEASSDSLACAWKACERRVRGAGDDERPASTLRTTASSPPEGAPAADGGAANVADGSHADAMRVPGNVASASAPLCAESLGSNELRDESTRLRVDPTAGRLDADDAVAPRSGAAPAPNVGSAPRGMTTVGVADP